jgi:hypothetical protein
VFRFSAGARGDLVAARVRGPYSLGGSRDRGRVFKKSAAAPFRNSSVKYARARATMRIRGCARMCDDVITPAQIGRYERSMKRV